MAATIEQGFVIKKQNYADNDLIVTILTLEGKLSFIALGVRKLKSKNRIALQLGNLIEIEFFRARLNNKLSKLKKAHSIKQFPIETSDSAEVMLEILNLINKINFPKTFFYETLILVFNDFGEKYNHHIKTYIYYLILKQQGINPIMNHCAECNLFKNIIDFKWFKGGFLCTLHSNDKTKLNKLKAYRSLGIGYLEYKNIDSKINFDIKKEIKNYLNTS